MTYLNDYAVDDYFIRIEKITEPLATVLKVNSEGRSAKTYEEHPAFMSSLIRREDGIMKRIGIRDKVSFDENEYTTILADAFDCSLDDSYRSILEQQMVTEDFVPIKDAAPRASQFFYDTETQQMKNLEYEVLESATLM